ncbi:MAG: DNA-processing protein DprA [Bermanella sp.]
MDVSIFEKPNFSVWLNLALVPGIGPKTMQAIKQAEINIQQIYALDSTQLKLLGLNKKSIEYLQKYPPSSPSAEVEQTLKWAQQNHHYLLTPGDSNYPDRLKHIATVPPLLMVKGRIEALKYEQLAIVGSRYPTPAGEQQAYEFAQALTNLGLTITSGLAKGVDAAAHLGALESGGATIAVLGNGFNEIYPKQHVALAEEICEKGALVSEFGLWAKPHPGHFPRRNRIVSGLSMGTLVVEATLKSGSLITARQALEQNRDVFAIPGPISNPQKAGCHHLIRQGAVLVETPLHIVEELKWQHSEVKEEVKIASPKIENITHEQEKLIKALDYEGANLDELVRRTKLPIMQLNVLLMEMELTGLVRQNQGEYSLV